MFSLITGEKNPQAVHKGGKILRLGSAYGMGKEVFRKSVESMRIHDEIIFNEPDPTLIDKQHWDAVAERILKEFQ